MNSSYSDRLAAILDRIHSAARLARRAPGEIRLVAVSKTHPPAAVAALADAGQTLFGESRVQEARAKIPLLPSRLKWHFIGHLQKNKIRQALPLFEMIHGIDSIDLGVALDRIAGEEGFVCRGLLEVNLAGESSKFGLRPDALPEVIEALAGLRHVEIHGLMCIPPPATKPEDSRPHFARLRGLRDELERRLGAPLPELSMGMSNDFEVAVSEGATLVRVGTALFGPRPLKEDVGQGGQDDGAA